MAEAQEQEYEEVGKDDEDSPKSSSMTDAEIVLEFRDRLKTQMEDEAEARKEMLDDLKFSTLDQWDPALRQSRENDPNGARPCLTIDKINQYINQVTNSMRQNKPGIKVGAVDSESDPGTAKVIQGAIRNIEDQSCAQVAYETASDCQVKVGVGYFRIVTDYESDESFDQEIKLMRIADSFSVYLGPHTQPDGSDAPWGAIIEKMPIDKYKATYPNASFNDEAFMDDLHIWKTDKEILVAEYYYMVYEKKTLLFLNTGKTVFKDKFDGAEDSISEKREVLVKKVKYCKISGSDVLEKKDWLGKYIPIVEMIGKESFVEGKRILWGLVRPAKDNLRLYNYWVSAATEKIGLSPKTPYIGAVGQFKTQGDRWANANVMNYATLEYDAIDVNGNAIPPPRRGEPAPIETAIIGMMQIIDRDVKTSLGMFNASLGEGESQQSGRAINALQSVGDTGTFHFQDNRNRSIQHAGRIIFDLIPKIMDTKRIVRVLGEDGSRTEAQIDPNQKTAKRELTDTQTGKIKSIYNPGVGKYDISISTGPSYKTNRTEAVQVFTELARTAKDPGSAAVLNYLTVKNSDIASSDEATDMLKMLLPPQVQQPEGQEKIPPQAMAKIQQMQQAGQQLQQQLQEVGQENQQLKSGAQEKHAELQLKSQSIQAELQLKKSIQEEELRLEREKVESTLELNRMVAEAKHAIDKQNHEFSMDVKRRESLPILENEVMPQLLGSLNNAFAEMGNLLQQQLQMQAQTLEAQNNILAVLQAPKAVSIGNVQKDKDGRIIGATVNTTI